mgnify:CR=1 FL=1
MFKRVQSISLSYFFVIFFSIPYWCFLMWIVGYRLNVVLMTMQATMLIHNPWDVTDTLADTLDDICTHFVFAISYSHIWFLSSFLDISGLSCFYLFLFHISIFDIHLLSWTFRVWVVFISFFFIFQNFQSIFFLELSMLAMIAFCNPSPFLNFLCWPFYIIYGGCIILSFVPFESSNLLRWVPFLSYSFQISL